MNEGNMFQTAEEVARELAGEIRQLKEVLRDISRKLGHIETRVRRVFPTAFPPTGSGRKDKQSSAVTEQPTLSPQEALGVYEEVVQLAKVENRDQAKQRLESLVLPDLALLCRELGVSVGKKKASRHVLIKKILGRVQESLMLSSSSLRERSGNALLNTDAATDIVSSSEGSAAPQGEQ